MAIVVTVEVDTSKEMNWRPLRFPDMDERSKEEDSSLRASRSTLLPSFNAGDSSKLILVNIFENYTSHRVIELKQIIDSNKKKNYAFVVSIPSLIVSVSASL